MLQQYLPLAVLKHSSINAFFFFFVRGCNSTYRLRYWNNKLCCRLCPTCKLQQYLPLAVLKLSNLYLQSYLVHIWSCNSTYRLRYWNLIIKIVWRHFGQDMLQQYLPLAVLKLLSAALSIAAYESCNSTYRLRYWNDPNFLWTIIALIKLQQYLPLAVLKLIIKVMLIHLTRCSGLLQQYLPLAVLKQCLS